MDNSKLIIWCLVYKSIADQKQKITSREWSYITNIEADRGIDRKIIKNHIRTKITQQSRTLPISKPSYIKCNAVVNIHNDDSEAS